MRTKAGYAVGALLGVALMAPSGAAAADKTYTVKVGPASAPASSDATYTAVYRNTGSGPQPLGSANLTAPEGFVVKSASSSQGEAAVSGRTVQLRNLNLAPGASLTATLVADTTGVTGYWSWSSAAKQSNDFNGTGNDFYLDLLGSSLVTEVTPNDGAGGSQVACPEEPANAQDTTCRNTVVHRGIVPGTESNPQYFTASLKAIATPALAGNAGTLSLRLPTAENIDCLTFSETSPVSGSVTGPGNRSKVVTFTIDMPQALGAVGGLCYAQPTPFATVGPGVPFVVGQTPFFTGALPDCSVAGLPSIGVATPCIRSKSVVAGNQVIVAEIPAFPPDPYFRGG